MFQTLMIIRYNYDYKNQNTNYNCNRLRWIMYMFKKNCQCKYMDLNYSNILYSSSLTMFIILFSLQIICTNHHLSYNILIQIKLIALLFCLCVRLCCQIVHALFIGHVKYHIYVACLKANNEIDSQRLNVGMNPRHAL